MSIDQLPGIPGQERPTRAIPMISGPEIDVASRYLLSDDQECPKCAEVDSPHLIVHFGGTRGDGLSWRCHHCQHVWSDCSVDDAGSDLR